ncbi:hypothetical protein [Niabella drilacis]|uniref:hypothetical protein n=1 Tax=Niabella drilacis (strain DSM 25811 / CCM 8410 / CCUG 62505 / LMG 26954 / E90) TaxID=1285928 RepID=UPI00115FAB0D|nr:hypothetical protein [Niabella drilacis]
METTTFSRQQLYDLVWSESLLALSKKYDISDIGLLKVCKHRNIPLPGMEHWNKVQTPVKYALFLRIAVPPAPACWR